MKRFSLLPRSTKQVYRRCYLNCYFAFKYLQIRLVEAIKEYGAKAVKVQCGHQHTLILTEDGEILSCGQGEYGRLGTGQ